MASEEGKEWNQKVYELWRKYMMRVEPKEYFRMMWICLLMTIIMGVSSIIGSYYFSNYIAGLVVGAVACIVGYLLSRMKRGPSP
jgi:hypothetical protein